MDFYLAIIFMPAAKLDKLRMIIQGMKEKEIHTRHDFQRCVCTAKSLDGIYSMYEFIFFRSSIKVFHNQLRTSQKISCWQIM